MHDSVLWMFYTEQAVVYLWVSEYIRYSNSFFILWQQNLSWPKAFCFQSQKSGGHNLRVEEVIVPVLSKQEETSFFA